MKTAITLLLTFFTTTAFADALRSDKHLVKIDAQSRQYNVQIFDAASRDHIAHLKVDAKGDTPAESETTVNGTRYTVRIEPHGEAYLVHFTADDGGEGVDIMRGGFTTAAKTNPQSAHPARGGRDTKEPTVLRRIDAVYTEAARAAGAAGTVVLDAVIDKSGFVREATVVKPMGYGLDESAIDAVKQWQFEPSMQGRKSIEVLQEVTIEFKP